MTATQEVVAAQGVGGTGIVSITPEPTDAEHAAIVAAVDAFRSELWPHLVAATSPAPSGRWRYAGRSWRRRTRYGGWT